ncbi:hypothetical protein E2C01_069760 [Portunus trituberculatus]|uniref:Uncharacterized protein n=1 Tax=Portunus trituberculatus TaxID=210409 RepID=A0A5B7I3N4_PORTR|nr:hypothetical protein [Portunus trituberculatus]
MLPENEYSKERVLNITSCRPGLIYFKVRRRVRAGDGFSPRHLCTAPPLTAKTRLAPLVKCIVTGSSLFRPTLP